MKSACPYPCYRTHTSPGDICIKTTKRISLIFFDMDGVLTDTYSSWRHIHDYFGTSNERSVDAYLKGQIDDLEFMRRDISLWTENGQLIKEDIIHNILNDIPLMKGGEEFVNFLHRHNMKTAIVSAGLDILAKKVAKKFDIDYVFANGVKTDIEGRLTGEGILQVPLIHKDKVVRQLSEKLKIPLEKCAAVGNSCFDVPMFEACGIGIAFNPEDDCVRKSADIIIEGKDLRKIIPAIRHCIQ